MAKEWLAVLIGMIAVFGTGQSTSPTHKSAPWRRLSVLHFDQIAEYIVSNPKLAPFALDATWALWIPHSIVFGVALQMPIFPMTQLLQPKSILLSLKLFSKNLLSFGAVASFL